MDLVYNSSLTGGLIIFVSSFVLFFFSFICSHFLKTKCDILGRVKVSKSAHQATQNCRPGFYIFVPQSQTEFMAIKAIKSPHKRKY